MAAPPPGARCAKHAEAAAVDLCQRCGSFVCSDCIEIRSEEVYCPSCAAILDRPASKRARSIFWLSLLWPVLLGLLFLLAALTRIGSPVGVALMLTPLEASVLGGLWFAERRAIRRGEAPARGQNLMRIALGALVLSAMISVGTVLLLVFAVRVGGA